MSSRHKVAGRVLRGQRTDYDRSEADNRFTALRYYRYKLRYIRTQLTLRGLLAWPGALLLSVGALLSRYLLLCCRPLLGNRGPSTRPLRKLKVRFTSDVSQYTRNEFTMV